MVPPLAPPLALALALGDAQLLVGGVVRKVAARPVLAVVDDDAVGEKVLGAGHADVVYRMQASGPPANKGGGPCGQAGERQRGVLQVRIDTRLLLLLVSARARDIHAPTYRLQCLLAREDECTRVGRGDGE